MKLIKSRISPLGIITVMLAINIMTGLVIISLLQFNTVDLRNLLITVNETGETSQEVANTTQIVANSTNQLAKNLAYFIVNTNKTSNLMTEIRENQEDIQNVADNISILAYDINSTQSDVDGFIRFIGESFDAEYLIDEVRQYGQSNNTYGNLTLINEKLDMLLGNST